MRSKNAVYNIISSVVLQCIIILFGLIVPRIIISEYGSSVNGLISSITQFLAFVTLLEAGFGPMIKSILYKPIATQDKTCIAKILKTSDKIFKNISYIFIVYIVLLCCIMPFVVINEFDIFFTISLIVIIAISIFAEYYWGMTYRLFLQAEQKTYVVSIIQTLTLVLNILVIWILVYYKANIQIVKLASSLIFVLRPILQNMYVKKKYDIDFKNVDGDYKINQKWDGLAQHIAYVIHSNVDIVILTLYGSLAEVSVYSVYYMVIEGVKNVVKSFVKGLDATFGDMIAKDEKSILNKSFKVYEQLYFSVTTIVFGSTLILINSFIKIYTNGINDANYIRPTFAILMVIAELINLIRQPYNDLVKVAGHFKQTQIGAWFEAISNIVISFILVWKFGIIGVAIGTIFAMFVRTVEFVCYTSKHILERSLWYSIKWLGTIVTEVIIISIIMNFISKFEVYNYATWILNAVEVVGISAFVVCTINLLIHKESSIYILTYLKNKRSNNR